MSTPEIYANDLSAVVAEEVDKVLAKVLARRREMHTFELAEELEGRAGVETIHVLPHANYTVATETKAIFKTGPATIIVIN
ncbi:MAG: BC1881 family protein [Holosporales bacterium]|jgi:hypothetical protein|nr:BC1881 family protein [Holosporales bacterium]